MIATARTILRKDLLIELRTKESVPAMTLFAITVYVLFHFGLDRDSLDGELASGVFWVTLLLAAVIGVSRLFAAELLEPLIGRPSGRTRVLVTHDVRGALAEADAVLRLRRGRPVAEDEELYR